MKRNTFRAIRPWLWVALFTQITGCLPTCDASLLIANPSFESPASDDSLFLPPEDWTIDMGTASIQSTPGGLAAPEGDRQVVLGNTGGQQISQEIGTLERSQYYRASFYVGWEADDPNFIYANRRGTLKLMQGSHVLLELNHTFNPWEGDKTGTFIYVSGYFLTTPYADMTTPVVAQLSSFTADGVQTSFDNVNIEVIVPEPSTWMLCSLAIALGLTRILWKTPFRK